MQNFPDKLILELKIRNYSPKTIKSYSACLKDYLFFVKNQVLPFNLELLRKFLFLKFKKGLSSQTVNVHLKAIKFFYREVLNFTQNIDIKFAKTPQKLPVVLSKTEILKIIDSISNQKHKLLITLSYGAGFRVSEAINLRVGDLDLEQMTIHIKEAKGKKDRITVFPEKLKINIAEQIITDNEKEAEQFLAEYYQFVIDFSQDDIKEAAQLKLEYKKRDLSMTDCIGYVLADRLGIKFLTGDKEFKDFENVEFIK